MFDKFEWLGSLKQLYKRDRNFTASAVYFREVMAFKEEVRKAKPVKFALQVLSAVQDNNYIRFFKLLK